MSEHQEAYERLAGLIREELERPGVQFTLDSSCESIDGWDSLAQVRIVAAVEREFDIEIALEKMEHLLAVRDFLETIVARQAAV